MKLNQHPLVLNYIQSNKFGELLGMNFEIIDAGEVVYFLKINQSHLATPKAAHGGSIAALIDGALGVAALSAVCEENKVVSTIEFKLNYFSPALVNDEIVAKAKVEQKGKRILFCSCEVSCVNRNNIVIAKAMGTFNAYDAVKAGY
jgi:uncharacterized protein (TIGR00369 family)